MVRSVENFGPSFCRCQRYELERLESGGERVRVVNAHLLLGVVR